MSQFNYVYPPRFINGQLYSSVDPIEVCAGKILQTIEIIKGELIYSPFFGLPYNLFTSITQLGIDVQAVEQLLTENIPEADFYCTASMVEEGDILLNINWSYFGQKNDTTLVVTYP